MQHPGHSFFPHCPPLNKMAASGHSAQTDRELRAELKRLGFTAGPVTDSTRQVLLKKLAKLQADEKRQSRASLPSSQAPPSRKLLGFSSDESDGEAAAAAAANRRRSMPALGKNLRRRSVKARPATATPHNGTAEVHADASAPPAAPPTTTKAKPRASDTARPNTATTTTTTTSAKSKRYSTGALPSSAGKSLTSRASEGGTGSRREHTRSRRATFAMPPSRVAPKKDEFSDSDVDGEENDEEAEMDAPNGRGERQDEAASHGGRSLNQTYSVDGATTKDASLAAKSKTPTGPWWSTAKPSPRRSLQASSPRTSTPRKHNNRLSLADVYNEEEEEEVAAADASKGTPARNNNSSALAPVSRNSLNSSRHANPVHGALGPGLLANNKHGSGSFANSRSDHSLAFRQATAAGFGAGKSRGQPGEGRGKEEEEEEEEENLLEEFATEDHCATGLGARIGHHVPRILLSCAFLFFIILAMVYMNVGASNLEDVKYMYIADHSSAANQMPSEEVQHTETMRIVQALYDKLSEVAGKHVCGSADVTSRNMSLDEARAFLKHEFREDINKFWLNYHLNRALQKILNNSQWGLRLFEASGEPLVGAEWQDGVGTETAQERTAWLESEHLTMSWLCRVRRSAALVLFRLFLLFLAVLFLWLAYKYMLYRMRREKEVKTQVHQLVDAITEMLASHHKASGKDKDVAPYLAIPHVRDTLIPLKYRKEKQHLWDRAVHFINTHESRVRVETQQVSGEEFLVWRWMLPSPVVVRQSSFTPITELELNPNRVKVWQGTAFDNLDTAIKSPRYIPTPCLKIRNMFDPTLESDGDWHVAIEDAILERCGERGAITHVAVDRTSREGCVYVKCLTNENAGHAYKALQGSWFDGKLVTVKYLRLERYYQRFPGAISCNVALRPSNNLKRSLSHHNQSPGLECS